MIIRKGIRDKAIWILWSPKCPTEAEKTTEYSWDGRTVSYMLLLPISSNNDFLEKIHTSAGAEDCEIPWAIISKWSITKYTLVDLSDLGIWSRNQNYGKRYSQKKRPHFKILLDLVIISQRFLSSPHPVLDMVQTKWIEDTNNCQILFFGSSSEKRAQVANIQRS